MCDFFENVMKVTHIAGVDVGCCDRIVDGRIKLKAGVEVKSFEPNAVVFTDGTRAEADVVIFA